MSPNDLLQMRREFILRRRKSPTEAYMHFGDIVDVGEALRLWRTDRVYGMRLIPADQERGRPLLTWSRIDS